MSLSADDPADLFGREDELALVERLLDQAQTGQGDALVLAAAPASENRPCSPGPAAAPNGGP